MNSAREEILKLSNDRLRNKVESIMFNVNMILSNPEKGDNHVDKMTELLIELSVAELAMKNSQALLTQCLEQRLAELEALQKLENKQSEKKPE